VLPTLTVPSTQYPTIEAAIGAAHAGDVIVLETGSVDETALVTVDNITIEGGAANTGIVLNLAAGIEQLTLAGDAPINVTGNDSANIINGNGGGSTLNGGDGDDAINSGAGFDLVDGGAGTDRLIVDYSASTTNFGGGIDGGSLADGYHGDWGDSADNGVAFSGIENFSIMTGTANDIVHTGDGDDMIGTGAGSDDIDAAGGDDTIDPGTGTDHVVGGPGTDHLIVDYSGFSRSVTVTAGSSADGYQGDVTVSFDEENSVAFFGIDTFSIRTGSANDTIRTGAGADIITAGAGDDEIDGGGGVDIAVFSGTKAEYSITPNADGSVTVTDLRDGSPDGSDRLINIEVAEFSDTTAEFNYAPVADNDSYVTAQNTALVILAAGGVLNGDSDGDGDTLRAVLVDGPTHGNLALEADGSFTYTPHADYHGPDSFTYWANDGEADSNVATVTLTVNEAARAPTVDAGADRTADEGQTVNLTATFTDPNAGDAHTATIDWGDGTIADAIIAAGRVSGSHAYANDGTYAVTVMVTDRTQRFGTDALTVTVNNVAPVAQNLDLNGPVEGGAPQTFSFKGTDAGSADALSYTILSSPSGGAVTNNGNGTFTFDPESDFEDLRAGETRAVSFTYRANDDETSSAPATVTISVAGVGAKTKTINDPLNAQPWSTQVSTYDSADRLVSDVIAYDDGTKVITAHDAAGTQSWTSTVSTFDSAGRLTSQTVNNDDGSHTIAKVDTLSQHDWFDFVAGYDSQWNKIYEDTRYDDGRLATYKSDVLNQHEWKQVTNVYDNLGRKLSEEQTRDDGSHWAWDFDPQDQFDWTNEFSTYDGQWNKLTESKTMDDGTTSNWHSAPRSRDDGEASFGRILADMLFGDGDADLPDLGGLLARLFGKSDFDPPAESSGEPSANLRGLAERLFGKSDFDLIS
jgi:hypothetical protein